jgi:glycosyltransferase involved in cell wall biosynthesis
MRILFGNNYYYVKGGSERVFFEEVDLLRSHDHEIIPFSVNDAHAEPSDYRKFFVESIDFSSKQGFLSKGYVASRILYSFHSRNKARQIIRATNPVLAHFHNIYHRLNPAVLPEFKKAGIPAVLTLHDYKLLCPIYTFYRDNGICELCRGGHYGMCFKNRCNKHSSIHSMISALEGYLHKFLSLYKKNLSYLISPSQFLANKFIEFGWNPDLICHVPNFINTNHFTPSVQAGDYFLYFGRLSKEKGIATLIEAFQGLPNNSKLVVAGGGPLEDELHQMYVWDNRIKFTGHITGKKMQEIVRGAKAVVVPSEWYENAPMSILEAMAYGKPVIGARIGGIPEMIQNDITGYLFEHGNVEDLRNVLLKALNNTSGKIEQMGAAARRFVEVKHSPELHYRSLMSIYAKALNSW